MSRLMSGVVMAVAALWLTAGPAQAQTTTSSETKTFEVLAVDGNMLTVRLPEGTRELTVADDFRFTVNGQQLSVRQLKTGMKGTATITTRTTVTPVTVTEVKDGTVVVKSGSTIIVRTPEGVKSFTQGEVDKRGVKIVKDGQPVQISQLREGDRLSAVIITSLPPKILTEQEVNATLATARASGAAAAPAPASAGGSRTAAPVATTAQANNSAAAAPSAARSLPKTASSWPVLAFASLLSLAIGFALTVGRRFVF